jgi:glutaredoxin 3
MKAFRSFTLFAASAVSAFVAPTTPTAHRIFVPSTFSKFSRLNMSTTPLSGATDFVTKEVADNKVVIFSKTYCPHCSKAVDLLVGQLEIPGTKVWQLDTMDNGADVQAALLEITGQRTVPNVFINQKHVGGNDNVQEAHRSGKLQELLNPSA